jgi:hypothetical protein
MDDPLAGQTALQAATANLNAHSQTRVDFGDEDRGSLLPTMSGRDRTPPRGDHHVDLQAVRRSSAVTQIKSSRTAATR